jgi:hypothetical protein
MVGSPPSSPVKDAIDSNSGRFEFLKQTLTLGLAGIAGIAALFTDQTRVPADSVSKWTIFLAAIGLSIVVSFAVMGLSAYANLLAATASDSLRQNASFYAKGVRNHARGVIIGLVISFVSFAVFAGYRLFFFSAVGTPESAIETSSTLVSKEVKQPPEALYLTRLEADNEAFTVNFFVAATNSEATVRVSKKDGSVMRLTQEKKASPKP